MQVISVDCGRSTGKGVTDDSSILIPSVVGEYRDLKIGDYGDYNVVINGERYFVGELAERESRFRREMVSRSKIHNDTAVITLTAIALLKTDEDFKIVTGLPVEQHDLATKQSYINLLAGTHEVTVNGITRKLHIPKDNIAISIEGGGAYWSDVITDPTCYIIDLGSRTINAVCVQHNHFRDVDSTTLNYGCLELANASEEPDDEVASQFVNRVYADLSRRWLNIGASTVLLTGGGALLLEPWLRKYYPTCRMSSDPVWANALGYYKLGLMKWQTRS